MAAETSHELSADDQRLLESVTRRLAERFPAAAPAAVESAVHRAWAGLSGARVREFVEIFVEREAAALLRVYAARPLVEQPRHRPTTPQQRRRAVPLPH